MRLSLLADLWNRALASVVGTDQGGRPARSAPPSAGFRPEVERLEDRLTPATTYYLMAGSATTSFSWQNQTVINEQGAASTFTVQTGSSILIKATTGNPHWNQTRAWLLPS